MFGVEDEGCSEYGETEVGGSEGRGELLLGENRSVVVWVDDGVVTAPLFWVDVPTACQCVGLRSKLTWPEPDYEVELREELRPSGLAAGQ